MHSQMQANKCTCEDMRSMYVLKSNVTCNCWRMDKVGIQCDVVDATKWCLTLE